MPQTRLAFLGASGRIGRLLRAADALQQDTSGPEMIWQFRDRVPVTTNGFLWPDFSDPQPIMAAHDAMGFDALLIFSGVTREGQKEDPKAMSGNVTLVDQAISGAAKAGISRILVASSSAVYGPGLGRPFKESDTLAPLTAYGAAKAEMEALCARRSAEERLEICTLRIGNVAGADMLLSNVAAWGPSDPPLSLDLFSNGAGPRRSYVGPRTFLKLIKWLSVHKGPLPPCLNVAGTRPVEMNRLLDTADAPWQGRLRETPGHQNITLDCTLLEDLCTGVDLACDASEIIAEWQACLEWV